MAGVEDGETGDNERSYARQSPLRRPLCDTVQQACHVGVERRTGDESAPAGLDRLERTGANQLPHATT